jgi:hypothetical protein
LFIANIGEIRAFLDGRCFLRNGPLQSGYFLVASLVGLVAFVADGYLIYRQWSVPHMMGMCGLAGLIGIQIVYQWWRALRYYAMIRKLYSLRTQTEAQDGTPLDAALRIATGGLTDILFYSYGMLIVSLAIIGLILRHLEPVR